MREYKVTNEELEEQIDIAIENHEKAWRAWYTVFDKAWEDEAEETLFLIMDRRDRVRALRGRLKKGVSYVLMEETTAEIKQWCFEIEMGLARIEKLVEEIKRIKHEKFMDDVKGRKKEY